jgi:cyclophilin family peptidyl-prolyl cis-trans isomerase
MIQGGDPGKPGCCHEPNVRNGGPGIYRSFGIPPKLNSQKRCTRRSTSGDQVNPKKASSGSQFYIVQGQDWTDMQLEHKLKLSASQSLPGFKYTEDQKQIYKTLGGTSQLDMNYTVFGEVIAGLDHCRRSIAAQISSARQPTIARCNHEYGSDPEGSHK